MFTDNIVISINIISFRNFWLIQIWGKVIVVIMRIEVIVFVVIIWVIFIQITVHLILGMIYDVKVVHRNNKHCFIYYIHLRFHCCYMHHAVITNMPILEGGLRWALFTISMGKICFHPIRSWWEGAEVFMAIYVSRMKACYTLPCSFFSTQRNFLWILKQIKP